jgi:putative membrane protein
MWSYRKRRTYGQPGEEVLIGYNSNRTGSGFVRFLIFVLAILLVAHYVPGVVVEGFFSALVTAVVLGLLNLTVRPILFVLTLPIQLVTLGLFTVVINAALLLFVGTILEGFEVANFSTALIASIIISLISWAGNKFI